MIFLIELNKQNESYELNLVDVLLDAEYFASVCGFDYPIGELSPYRESATMRLVAEARKADNNPRIRYGLMVWHNRNYVPVVSFKETEDTIIIEINNYAKLPYPAISRTKAWLKGLEYYLAYKPDKKTCRELEKKARTLFLEGIYEPEFA